MSNPDYVGIEGETFTDSELEDNFQDYLDNEMPEFIFGNLSYGAGRTLRQIDYTAFREEFNNWIDGKISEGDLREYVEPECEDCGATLSQDDVTESLYLYDRLVCPSCALEDDNEE